MSLILESVCVKFEASSLGYRKLSYTHTHTQREKLATILKVLSWRAGKEFSANGRLVEPLWATALGHRGWR